MYKQYSGLITNDYTPKEIVKTIHDIYYRPIFTTQSNKLIEQGYNDDYVKQVDPLLLPIVGEYTIKDTVSNSDRNNFISKVNDFCNFLLNNNQIEVEKKDIFSCKYYGELNLTPKPSILTHVIDRVAIIDKIRLNRQNIDKNCEYIIVDGRSEKIIRFIKKQVQQAYIITDQEFEQSELVLWYNKYITVQKKDLTVVITNSLISTIGMSSYATTRLWSSCQTINRASYSDALWSNLLDRNSLICYITNKVPTDIYIDNYTYAFNNSMRLNTQHNDMIARVILRLVKDGKGNTMVIPDRCYPNSKYIVQLVQLLKRVCNEHGLQFTLPRNYNYAQNKVENLPTDELFNAGYSMSNTEPVYLPNLIPLLSARGRLLENYNDQTKTVTRFKNIKQYTTKYTVYHPNNLK